MVLRLRDKPAKGALLKLSLTCIEQTWYLMTTTGKAYNSTRHMNYVSRQFKCLKKCSCQPAWTGTNSLLRDLGSLRRHLGNITQGTKFGTNKTSLPPQGMAVQLYLNFLAEYYFNHIFRNSGEFFTWECFSLEIGHFHSCIVNSNEGEDWLGRLESKHGWGSENLQNAGWGGKNVHWLFFFSFQYILYCQPKLVLSRLIPHSFFFLLIGLAEGYRPPEKAHSYFKDSFYGEFTESSQCSPL